MADLSHAVALCERQHTGLLEIESLKVRRRARQVYLDITQQMERNISDPLAALDWVNRWALSVNEENAAGGRVVTAPTNGAAGLLPAVLRYYDRFYRGDAAGRRTFLLTAAAIGALYKKNASISGAEVGCQGEVGVACSMAAAGLAAALGATNAQIENVTSNNFSTTYYSYYVSEENRYVIAYLQNPLTATLGLKYEF